MTLEEIEAQLGTVACLGGQATVLAKKCQELIEQAVSPDNSEFDPFEDDLELEDFCCTSSEEIAEFEKFLQESPADLMFVTDTTTANTVLGIAYENGNEAGRLEAFRDVYDAVVGDLHAPEDAVTQAAVIRAELLPQDFCCRTDEEISALEAFLESNSGAQMLVTDVNSIGVLVDKARSLPTGAPTWEAPAAVALKPYAELREQFAGVIDQMADEEDAKTKKALLKEAAARLRAYELPGGSA